MSRMKACVGRPQTIRPRHTRSRALPLVCALLLAGLLTDVLRAQAAPSQSDGPNTSYPELARVKLIDNDSILRMHSAGLADDLLVQTIELQPGRYRTSPDDLISLKQAGLSDKVIAAMQAHGSGLTTHVGHALRNSVDPAPMAPGIDEIGVYYKDKNGEWQMLQTERVEFRGSNRLKQVFTDGILREDTNGWVDGGQSPLVLPTGTELLVFTPIGTQGTEYDLLRFNEHKSNRDFRVKTGGVFHSQTGAQRNEIVFQPKKIAAQTYTFTIPKDIEKGEYGVLPPGSSNQQGLASAGKIFTFSIRE